MNDKRRDSANRMFDAAAKVVRDREEAESLQRAVREAAVGRRWIVRDEDGGERDFGRDEGAARANLAATIRRGRAARLYRMTPTEETEA